MLCQPPVRSICQRCPAWTGGLSPRVAYEASLTHPAARRLGDAAVDGEVLQGQVGHPAIGGLDAVNSERAEVTKPLAAYLDSLGGRRIRGLA